VVEQVINRVATGIGGVATFAVTSGIAFVIFGLLWLAIGIGLIWSQGSVDAAWQWVGDLPLIVQAVVWLLFLPVTLGLWIWETSWPFFLRLALVAALAGWTLLIFFPRGTPATPA
jgi:hypothetical protein